MKLSQIKNVIKSQRVINGIVRQMLWQNLSNLTFNAPRLGRAEKNAHRSEGAKKVVDQFNQKLAIFWGLFAQADAMGIQYDVTDEVTKLICKPMKLTSDKDINALAEATGFSIERIKADELKTYEKRLSQEDEKLKTTLTAIMNGEFHNILDDVALEELATIKAESALEKADGVQTWLLTWDKKDWAEMIIVKADMDILKKYVAIEENQDVSTEEIGSSSNSMQETAYMRIVNG